MMGIVWLAVGLTSCGGGSSDTPPPATQETVAGIDANGDGVRDDVEVYIDTTYPVPAQRDTNRALRQVASAAQVTMCILLARKWIALIVSALASIIVFRDIGINAGFSALSS